MSHEYEQLPLWELVETELAAAPGLETARALLRGTQAKWAEPSVPTRASPLEVARHMSVARQQKAQSVPIGVVRLTPTSMIPVEGVQEDGFIYQADIERARWHRTDEIIERVRPGPHEDGILFERLARQAATIEMSLQDGAVTASGALDRVLIGTVGKPVARANSQLVQDHVVVTVSTGTTYLIQRCAEAHALLARPAEPALGMAYSVSTNTDELAAHIADAPETVSLVAEPLMEWLYGGSVVAPVSVPVPSCQFQATMAADFAYRFVLAHEYAHAFVDLLRVPGWVDVAQVAVDGKEVGADGIALQLLGLYVEQIDRVAKNVALIGPVLALKAREITERAIQLAREGKYSTKHEARAARLFRDRLEFLFSAYRTLVAPGSDDTDLDCEPAEYASMQLEAIYAHVARQIVHRYARGDRLHSSWEHP